MLLIHEWFCSDELMIGFEELFIKSVYLLIFTSLIGYREFIEENCISNIDDGVSFLHSIPQLLVLVYFKHSRLIHEIR